MKLPKVTHEGKIGSVDCYVLDDGRCVLSGNQAVAAIVGKPAGNTGLALFGRYWANLSKQIGELPGVQVIECIGATGQEMKAIDDESFSNICQAYTDGLVNGTLHTQTIPVAQRAYGLQKSWAKVGLRTAILIATGMKPKTVVAEAKSFIERVLRSEPRDYSVVFDVEFVDAIRRVYGYPRRAGDSKRQPRFMAAIYCKFYRKFLGTDIAKIVKDRNPYPSSNTSLHHQWLVDEVLRELQSMRSAIIYIAGRSGRSVHYFWEQIDELLRISRPYRGIIGWRRKDLLSASSGAPVATLRPNSLRENSTDAISIGDWSQCRAQCSSRVSCKRPVLSRQLSTAVTSFLDAGSMIENLLS